MPSFHRTFRLFISSTFSDLRKERDALHEKVFPEIKQFCEDRGYSFQPVDLRWGVNEEAGFDQRTMKICMEEINACKSAPKPNFLVMLGDRYGWIPLPYEIQAAEFERLQKEIEGIYKNDPQKIALLNEWYQKDENTLPPVYVLQPRKNVFEDIDTWEEVENLLRELFISAAEALKWDKEKFITSATEREVFEGIFSEGDKSRSYFFSRTFKNNEEKDEKDIIEQIAEKDIRDKASFIDLANSFHIDNEKRNRLLTLKEKIKNSLNRENIKEYEIEADLSKPSLEESIQDKFLDQICLDVKNLLLKDIQAQIEGFQQVDPLSKELQEQQEFLEEKLKLFIGREEYLEHISSYLQDPEKDYPLVIYGESGCGKTALMAKAVSMVLEKREEEIFYHFVGATEYSSKALFVIRSIYQQMDQLFGFSREENWQDEELLNDFGEFSKLFKEALSTIPKDKKVVIFLDALDQYLIEDELKWLPDKLPGNVSIILSTLPEPYGGYLTRLRRIVAKEKQEKAFLQLPDLNKIETETLLKDFFQLNAQTLTGKQQALLRESFSKNRSPLYVMIVLKESLKWRSYTDTQELVIPESTEDLIAKLFEDLHRQSYHSRNLVRKGFAYLACAKDGLTESELFDMLSQEQDVMQDVSNNYYPDPQALPAALWARLHLEVSSYLVEKDIDNLLHIGFFHRKFREVAERLIGKEHTHQRLVGYFHEKFKNNFYSVRPLTELPYQLVNANQYEHASELLTDFDFLMGKLSHNKVDSVFEDYEVFLQHANKEQITRVFNIFYRFLRSNRHLLNLGNDFWQAHKIFFQFSIEHADNSLLTLKAEKWLNEDKCKWHWLRDIRRDKVMYLDPCKTVLEGHTEYINGAIVLPNGDILSWAGETTLRIWDTEKGKCKIVLEGHKEEINGTLVLPNGDVLSWSEDKTLKIWDTKTGRYTAVLKGHKRKINGALILPNGDLLSWSEAKNLKIWDTKSGQCKTVLKWYNFRIKGTLLLPNGDILTWFHSMEDWWGRGNILRIWDTEKGKCKRVLEGHIEEINGALVLPNGDVLSWSKDKTLKIWDTKTGRSIAVLGVLPWYMYKIKFPNASYKDRLGMLEGHTGAVNGALILPNGNVLSWSTDRTLRIWDTKTAKCKAVLEGHTEEIKGVIVLPNGDVLSWPGLVTMYGSTDKTLRIWDTEKGQCKMVLEGHTEEIYDVLILTNGDVLSWSADKTLRIWDTETANCKAVLRGHTGEIYDAIILPNGNALSWSGLDTLYGSYGSKDTTLRVWDTKTANCTEELEGHTKEINGVLLLSNEKLLSWSRVDTNLRIWDTENGHSKAVLEGHTSGIYGALILPNEDLLTWSADHTLRIWDTKSSQCKALLKGHTGIIYDSILLKNGDVLSWSADHTLRIWDTKSCQCKTVLGLHFDKSNRKKILNASYKDRLEMLEGHTGEVNGALILPNSHVLSWSKDKTLRIWDTKTAKCKAILRGHTGEVNGALVLPNGYLLSWSADHTLRIWDTKSSQSKALLKGHTGIIYDSILLSNGDVLSWSADHTLRIWDTEKSLCEKVIPINLLNFMNYPQLFAQSFYGKRFKNCYVYVPGQRKYISLVKNEDGQLKGFGCFWVSKYYSRALDFVKKRLAIKDQDDCVIRFLELYNGKHSVDVE